MRCQQRVHLVGRPTIGISPKAGETHLHSVQGDWSRPPLRLQLAILFLLGVSQTLWGQEDPPWARAVGTSQARVTAAPVSAPRDASQIKPAERAAVKCLIPSCLEYAKMSREGTVVGCAFDLKTYLEPPIPAVYEDVCYCDRCLRAFAQERQGEVPAALPVAKRLDALQATDRLEEYRRSGGASRDTGSGVTTGSSAARVEDLRKFGMPLRQATARRQIRKGRRPAQALGGCPPSQPARA